MLKDPFPEMGLCVAGEGWEEVVEVQGAVKPQVTALSGAEPSGSQQRGRQGRPWWGLQLLSHSVLCPWGGARGDAWPTDLLPGWRGGSYVSG